MQFKLEVKLAVWKDVVGGLLIAGALAAWVPFPFWNKFFLTRHPIWSKLWGPIVGPLVAIVSFVCSIGNVPLAAVLWNGGSSFGGVIAFIYADLIVIPILDIYRKYFGLKMSAFLLGTMYVSMASAALVIELIFQALHLRSLDYLELHDGVEYYLSGDCRAVVVALLYDRRREDGEDDGSGARRETRTRRLTSV